jgi:hypothetical protein
MITILSKRMNYAKPARTVAPTAQHGPTEPEGSSGNAADRQALVTQMQICQFLGASPSIHRHHSS